MRELTVETACALNTGAARLFPNFWQQP